MGLTGLAKKAIEKGKHEIKERVNPLSDRNKKVRQEHKDRKAKLQYTEQESYRKEQETQAEKRGERRAQREYADHKPSSGGNGRKRGTGKSLFKSMGGIPIYQESGSFATDRGMFIAPDPWGNPSGYGGGGRTSSNRSTPSRNTTIKTGNKTITIREQSEGQPQEKKKHSGYEFKDPFQF